MFTGIFIATTLLMLTLAIAMWANSVGPRNVVYPPSGQKTGFPLFLSADGEPEYKVGGITVDWANVTAVGADTTTPDGVFIANGKKYLRYGQVMFRPTQKEVQTVTITGTPTGGSFTLTLSRNGVSSTTLAIPYNATAAQVESALEALTNLQSPGLSDPVTVGGGPGPGTPYTVTFNLPEDVTQMTATGSFTGGSSPAVAVTTTTAGAAGAMQYRPATNADTLVNGDTVVMNHTVTEDDNVSTFAPGAIVGGHVFADRLLVGGAGQPTLANLLAVLPRLVLVKD